MMNKLRELYKRYIERDLGLCCVIGSDLCNSVMIVSTKLLETEVTSSGEPISPLQVVFVRMLITYAISVVYLKYQNIGIFGPKEVIFPMILRGVLGFFAIGGLYFSLIYIAISDAIVIQFLAPLFTSLMAYVFLKERFSKFEAAGGFVSLIGVLLIAKPSFIFGKSVQDDFDKNVETSDPTKRLIAILVAIFGIINMSGSLTTIRFIGHRANPVVMVSYFTLVSTIMSFTTTITIPSLSFKIPETLKQWMLVIIIGIAGFFTQFLMTVGLQLEKAGRAASMVYIEIIFGIAWELLIWHHFPNIWSLLGTILILGSSALAFYLKNREEAKQETSDEEVEMFISDTQEAALVDEYK